VEDPPAIEFDELLEGTDGAARDERRALLTELVREGFGADQLRRALAEDRLALLPVDRLFERSGSHTASEVAAAAGIELETLLTARSAFGIPAPDPGERALGESDIEMARRARTVLEAGVSLDQLVALNRVVGRSMQAVAAAARTMVAESSMRPGVTQRELAARWQQGAQGLTPLMEPVLGFVFSAHLRELVSNDVVGAADLVAGRTPGARTITVAFADLVGYTRLGEELPTEDLSALAKRLEELASEAAGGPVTLVKTLGDAAMLVAPRSEPLLEAGLKLLEAADAEGPGFPPLRVGVASGPALQRAGDWYGRPVNLASRVTGVARPGSLLATEEVRDDAPDALRWSHAGARRLRNVPEPVRLFRGRRVDPLSTPTPAPRPG